MPAHVAFLRAVNVGKRQLRMADARAWLAEEFDEVETYIQTGNVRVSSRMRSVERVAERMEGALERHCGFEVPCIVVTPAELRQVYEAAVAIAPSCQRQYVTFFKEPLSSDQSAALADWDVPGEGVRVDGRVAHWWLDKPMQEAKLSNARLERGGAVGTTRDLKVVTTLAERWGSSPS